MKYLVTGSFGFIGYSLSKRLLEQGHSVVGIDRKHGAISQKDDRIIELESFENFYHEECDICDGSKILKIFQKHNPDFVMHFAAQYAVAPLTHELLMRYTNSNCTGFANIIWAAKEVGCKRFFYASSTFVQNGEMSGHTYGATKHFNEHLASTFSNTYEMETVGVRYGSTFGPFCRHDIGPYNVAKRMFKGIKHPCRAGYLYQTAFLWVEDAIDVTLSLMDPSQHFSNKFNTFTLVMNDHRHSLWEMAKIMHEYKGIEFRPDQDQMPNFKPGGIPEEQLQKLENQIGYRPKTKMTEACQQFTDWFQPLLEAGKLK